MAVDLLGFGLSARPPFTGKTGQSAQQWWVRSLEAWRQQMGLTEFTLVGHSLGGFVVSRAMLSFCLQRVERWWRCADVADAANGERHRRPRMLCSMASTWRSSCWRHPSVRWRSRAGCDAVADAVLIGHPAGLRKSPALESFLRDQADRAAAEKADSGAFGALGLSPQDFVRSLGSHFGTRRPQAFVVRCRSGFSL